MTTNTCEKPIREWPASLHLEFAHKRDKTRIVHNQHFGPLRVLKPFYPEGNTCHCYLLHPPGGLVLGDKLEINVALESASHSLITTPSAGKVYTTEGAKEHQYQSVSVVVNSDAVLEWLPQETIIFDGANALLETTITLKGNAKLAMWDIVCFGRPASNLDFESGKCLQAIHIHKDDTPLLIERNLIHAGSDIQSAQWGMNQKNSVGTFILTVDTHRKEREQLLEMLSEQFDSAHSWGITQKQDLLIIRYLGDSAAVCKQGFELCWHQLRPQLCNKSATAPRIWAT